METLAKAVLRAAAFLEFSNQDTVNPDDAVRALEDIAATLQSASPDEIAAIRTALQELIAEERTSFARVETLRFYEHFLESVGLADNGLRT